MTKSHRFEAVSDEELQLRADTIVKITALRERKKALKKEIKELERTLYNDKYLTPFNHDVLMNIGCALGRLHNEEINTSHQIKRYVAKIAIPIEDDANPYCSECKGVCVTHPREEINVENNGEYQIKVFTT